MHKSFFIGKIRSMCNALNSIISNVFNYCGNLSIYLFYWDHTLIKVDVFIKKNWVGTWDFYAYHMPACTFGQYM